MSETFDTIIKGGTVVSHAGRARADVGIRDGKFAAVGNLSADQAGEVIDASGLHVLPGIIDSQVHFREPGLEWKEDLESGSRAAVMGGVTAVFEMPNTKPSTITPDLMEDKVKRGTDRNALRLCLLCRGDQGEPGRAARDGAHARVLRREGLHGRLDRGSAGR